MVNSLSTAANVDATPLRVFREAMRLHQQGRLREAEARYTRVLELDPRHFGALFQLGYLRLQQRRFAAAEPHFRRAVKINKQSADAHHHLAVALTGLGRPREALKHYNKACALAPQCAEAHNNLGHALQLLGHSAEALAEFEKALAINPNYPEARNNLASALHILHRPEEAIAQYRQALASRPHYPQAHHNLANALQALGRFEAAVAEYQAAIALAPGYAEAHNGLGTVLQKLGRSEQALGCFAQALALKQDYVEAHHNLGNTLMTLGRMEPAIAAFDAALALAPRRAGIYMGVVNTKRVAEGDRHFKAMLELARDVEAIPERERAPLEFALAKALADLGQHQQSFAHLLRGNALARRYISYDEKEVLTRFERTRAIFDGRMMRDKAGLGYPSEVPVFIVGMPRSGTTLVEQILASHPNVFAAGELRTMGNLVSELKGPDNATFPAVVDVLAGEQLYRLGESYVRALISLAPGAERIIDKMPANFQIAGLIHLALPNARIIHTCRDLRDTAFSCFSLLFADGQEFSYELGELGRYCRAYARLMQHWRQTLPSGVLLEVQYEELVEDLEFQAKRIVAHCGLAWDPRCLSFHETQRSVRTASLAQVRQPIYRSSVGRWRRHEAQLQPLLRALEA